MKDKSIVIMKADKTASCLVMDKEVYKSKVIQLLSTSGSFVMMNETNKSNHIACIIKKLAK